MARDPRHVLDAILAGVVVLDVRGFVEQLNAAACRLLERSGEAAIGLPVENLLGSDHALAGLARKVLDFGVSASQSDRRIERRMAGDVTVDVAASPLFDDRGELDGVVLVLRDRTLQRKLHRLEAERERHASFGRIAAGLAHEVKNPLGGIRGAAELLARRAEEDKTRDIAELIVREATRIAALVDEFMVFSKGGALDLRPTNVHQVLDGVLDLLAHDPFGSRAEVRRLFDPSLPELLADPDRLTQIFLNLGRNALQATYPAAGELTIITRMTLDHRVSTDQGHSMPTLEVRFEDAGPGMSEDVMRQATTPFFTTRPGGTGLGLAVAEYWTTQHGGALQLENRTGKGARVRVTLPLRRAP